MSPVRDWSAVMAALPCGPRLPAVGAGDRVKWCSKKSPSSRMATTLTQRLRYHLYARGAEGSLTSFVMISRLRLELRLSPRGAHSGGLSLRPACKRLSPNARLPAVAPSGYATPIKAVFLRTGAAISIEMPLGTGEWRLRKTVAPHYGSRRAQCNGHWPERLHV